MITLVIESESNGIYVLTDQESGKTYRLMFQFFGIDAPKPNDQLSLSDKLLDEKYEGFCQPYAFGVADKKELATCQDKTNYAVLKTEKKIIVLRRLYG